MELSAFLLESSVSRVAGVLAGLGVIVFFVWRRTKSSHSILERLWRALFGKLEIHDPTVRAFVEERRDLDAFSFVSGIRAERYRDIRSLVRWADQNRIDFSRLRKARWHLKLGDMPTITHPARTLFIGCGIGALAFYGVGLVSVRVAFSPGLILVMKDSGTTFVSDDIYARAFPARDWAVDLRSCSSPPISKQENSTTKLTDSDLQVLCTTHTDGRLAQKIKEELPWQRGIGVAGILVAVVVMCVCLQAMTSGVAARNILADIRRGAPD